MQLGEGLEGFCFGVESGDSFDEAGDGESVADAAGLANEMEFAIFAAEGDGHAHERRNARAVNLWHAVEHHNDLASAGLQDGLERHGELLAGIANGETAVHIKYLDAGVFANVDFDGSVKSHRSVRERFEQAPCRKALYDEAAENRVNEMAKVA